MLLTDINLLWAWSTGLYVPRIVGPVPSSSINIIGKPLHNDAASLISSTLRVVRIFLSIYLSPDGGDHVVSRLIAVVDKTVPECD